MKVEMRGDRVTLRDMREDDMRRLYYYEYEAEDREHLLWNGPYGEQEELTFEEFTERYAGHVVPIDSDQPRRSLMIEIDGELKGRVSRYWVSQETNWFEIGIVIYDSRYWSGGYGTEAFRMWMKYLFDSLDTVRLGIGTWSGNDRMMRLAAKCGMTLEARVRKARIVRGDYYDAIKMGILREEWDALEFSRREDGYGNDRG
ncbi:GNAT family N-acetyltransferase [Paenibacillus sp. NFR01]|uniref:GNAT family N-acetyltransferase n=1 Tax=Paenibacillus sp. NFR01 TaxID=1566279 RepID=UPI0008CD5A39|nr:GNAT family protein [Paenibacillus sp. NFR01]SET47070.1 Protein N-acetyltransferase, RimJ/RimL family [Paenibacillus sp. NFR01]